MTTTLEHLQAAAEATEARRRNGHPMTYFAGQTIMRHGLELVHLAVAVDGFLSGRHDRDAVERALAPLLSPHEPASADQAVAADGRA